MFCDIHVYPVEPPFFTRGMNGDIVELRDGKLLYAFAELPDGRPGIYACYSADRGPPWTARTSPASSPIGFTNDRESCAGSVEFPGQTSSAQLIFK